MFHRRRSIPRLARAAALGVMLTTLSATTGCNWAGWGAGIFRPAPGHKRVPVAAEYTGLQGKRIAVLVAADDYTVFRFPRATRNVNLQVGEQINTNVPGVTLSIPVEVDEYQKRNPYWTSQRPSQTMEDLGVDRLIVIDLNEYRTHEPGNQNLWRGVIDATVAVYEADAEDADNRVYERQVRASFPEDDKEFGLTKGSDDAMEAQVLQVFSAKTAGLFYDHEVMQ